MSTLDEKKKKLQESGFNFMEKKMLKTLLGSLGSMSLNMGCHIRSCIVNLSIPNPDNTEGFTVNVVVTNSENGNYYDLSHTAKELKDDNPIFEDLADKILDMVRECAEFWNTPPTNIVFQCWTHKTEDKVESQIKPREGFSESERLQLK